jgi:phospholipase C
MSAALADPGPARPGRLDDVRHVVVLMQENRWFAGHLETGAPSVTG